jgi:hypothetical protein
VREEPTMKALDGSWDVTIKTPIGSLAVVYTFAESDGLARRGSRLSANRCG